MRIDALATERHYRDHLLPIWQALDESERGTFYVSPPLEGPGFEVVTARRIGGNGLVLVASYGDEVRCAPRPVILLEHGAGQSYSNGHSSYAGGRGREQVRLFLCPNEEVAERNRKAYPQEASVAVVGCPRLDPWMGRARIPRDPPTIAISFHWQCVVSHESRSAWPHYRGALKDLAARYHLIGHGHPRIIDGLEPAYRAAGIEVVRDFTEVLERADVYVIDNSSTGVEAMAAGLAVVWMNAPEYRKNVSHGGRFWSWCEGIPTVDGPEQLPEAIARALTEGSRRREEIVREVYTFTDGQSAKRAAEAIRQEATSREGQSCPSH